MWGAFQRILGKLWGWVLAALAVIFVLVRLVSDWVGRSTFWEDLQYILKVSRPVTDFFARQPEWLFYPFLTAMLAVGFVLIRPEVAAALIARKAKGAAEEPAARKLGFTERDRIARSPSPRQGRLLAIQYVDKGDCYDYARSIHHAFEKSIGWESAPLQPIDGPARYPAVGAAIVVVDRNAFTNEEQLLFDALTKAGIKFEVMEGRDDENNDAAILVTPIR